jgi:DNA-binding CsgD family transcriptional regulator
MQDWNHLTEIFQPVAGYEGLYEVSNYGNIWSVPRGSTNNRRFGGYLLKQTNGLYPTVSLVKDGVVKNYGVHTLVCRAFHGPKPPDKHVAAHWDGDPKNNRIDNLRWATVAENKADELRHGTRNMRHLHTPEMHEIIRLRAIERQAWPTEKHELAVKLRASGLTYREIGDQLGHSGNTVWQHFHKRSRTLRRK